MSTLPNFTQYYYQVEKELGHNRAGGRVTYLAMDTQTRQPVVIKQFQFAKSQSWVDYDSYEREIQVLRELDHPGIPHYLDSFHTNDGFCLVQEYKHASSLAVSRSFSPDEVCQIAIAALEILVYLQNRIPSVIHRDIKPENLLVDDAGQVYLVDFGFARVGEGEVGVSSVVKGTLGFMPPEQLFNRQLTEASDLYGLGMTLICLLTNTKTDQIGELVDISYRVSFKHLIPHLSQQWIEWLEKMVDPRLNDRFPNAVTALSAIPASPLRPPEALLSQSTLVFKAERPGETLTQSLTISNPIPDTILEGHWEIAYHPHDPDPTLYQWISVDPIVLLGNRVECQVVVNTQKLMLGKTYSRKLLLHTNTLAQTYAFNVQVQTAKARNTASLLSYQMFGLLGLICFGVGWATGWLIQSVEQLTGANGTISFGAMLGATIGLEAAAWLMRSSGWRSGATTSTWIAAALGGATLVQVLSGSIVAVESAILIGASVGAGSGAITGLTIGTAVERLLVEKVRKGLTIGFVLLIAMLTGSLGLELNLHLTTNSSTLLFSILSGFVLIILALHVQLRRTYTTFTEQKSKQLFIKP
jgi:serine/threonine protein kinase